jgi:hypothetical protein
MNPAGQSLGKLAEDCANLANVHPLKRLVS